MRRLQGIAAAPGLAAAPPAVLAPSVGPAGGPQRSLGEAVAEAQRQLDALAERLRRAGRTDEAGILEAQSMLAADPELLDGVRRRVASGVAVDEAVRLAGDEAAEVLERLPDPLLAARGADLRDVAARLMRALHNVEPPRLERRCVVVAADLAPSITAELEPSLLAGIVLEGGSPTAHAAILARALGVPAAVGVLGAVAAARGANEVGVDGGTGEVAFNPDSAFLRRVVAWADARHERQADDDRLRDEPLVTADGHRVTLGANIGRVEEAAPARAAGAEAVGLLRTEFLFTGQASPPDERTQAAAYEAVLRAFEGDPVVIRLLDVGGDKPLPYLDLAPEANPFLGVRAIRVAERRPELLAGQLRAILAAAAAAGVSDPRIMAPMVADLGDVRMVHRALAEAAAAIGLKLGRSLEPHLGVMVEIPSAVLVADQLAQEVAFFSIGTNDLTQYLLAADRANPALASRQDPMHPAVLRAIASVIRAGAARSVPVAVCGEMAADPVGAVVLVGLGISELSMSPASFTAVKRALRSISLAEAGDLARECLDAPDASTGRRRVAERLGLASG